MDDRGGITGECSSEGSGPASNGLLAMLVIAGCGAAEPTATPTDPEDAGSTT